MATNYVITIFNKRYILRRYKSLYINNLRYVFLGFLDKNDFKPLFNCIFINTNNQIIMRSERENKTKIVFEVDGKPVPKGRPRFRSFGKFVSTYTDSKTITGEIAIREEFKKIKNLPKIPTDIPISIDMDFHLQIPSSLSNKKKLSLINSNHTKKPDLDNLCKTILDGLNKVAYSDDSLISKLSCRKIYTNSPKTIITLSY